MQQWKERHGETDSETGRKRGNRDAERYRKVCKDGFPSGASRGQLMTRPQIKVHPCVVSLVLWPIRRGPAEESCSLLYSTMTEFSLPNPLPPARHQRSHEKDTVPMGKSSESGGEDRSIR